MDLICIVLSIFVDPLNTKNNKIPSPPCPPTKNIIWCSYKACVTPPLTKVHWYWNVCNKFWPGCHHCLKFKCIKLCSFYSHLLSHSHVLTFSHPHTHTLTLTPSHSHPHTHTLTLTPHTLTAGTASHSLDYRKAAGAFIHGFRYTGTVL